MSNRLPRYVQCRAVSHSTWTGFWGAGHDNITSVFVGTIPVNFFGTPYTSIDLAVFKLQQLRFSGIRMGGDGPTITLDGSFVTSYPATTIAKPGNIEGPLTIEPKGGIVTVFAP
ncbi:MAG: hypothetical protein AAGJ54_02620 [Planctomycetota bacterium]